MNCAVRVLNFLLQSEPRVVEPTLIYEINDTIGPNGPGHHGNCVNYEPGAIFGFFQMVNFAGRSIPIDNVSLVVSQWHCAKSEPTRLSLTPAQPYLFFEGFRSCQSRAPFIR